MFWNKKPTIKFTTREDLLDLIPHPVPAMKAIPEWFRKLKPVVENSDKADPGTVKRCKPVLDAVSQGYIIPLWADIQVKVERKWKLFSDDRFIAEIEPRGDPKDAIGQPIKDVEGEPVITHIEEGEWTVYCKFPDENDMRIGDMIGTHSWKQVGNVCDLKKFKLGKVLLKFTNPWIIETPPGWSVKFQNPANNWSNDIEIVQGVVDTDKYYNEVNFPFVWKGYEEGEFIIERGTPLIHVIPFKRDDMQMEIGVTDETRKEMVQRKLSTKLFDKYATFFWHKSKWRDN